jgi:hypothetical protein
VVVIGCAGSGKSTLARQLAGRTGLPLVERDGLGEEGSPGYLSAMAEMAARPRWILDGAPYYADELVYAAADTVVFLDYSKALVLLAGAAAHGGHRSAPPPGGRAPAAGPVSVARPGASAPVGLGLARGPAPRSAGADGTAWPGAGPDPALHPPQHGAPVAALEPFLLS